MISHHVNVRALAEFALEQGDLRPALQLVERMQEGMQGHKLRQAAYAEGFESEVSVTLTTQLEGLSLTVQGRVDGLNLRADPPIVEEIKTTRQDPRSIAEDEYPVHWAQAEIYAHMVAYAQGAPRVVVRLTYAHLNGDVKTYDREMTSECLTVRFLRYAAPYAAWLARLDDWKSRSLPTVRALAFPFGSYRDGQREMAAQTYIALKHKRNLIVQAPTGIGKTAAALFGALKAMGEGHASRIFYLTARTTTRFAAEQALDQMRSTGLVLRSITLTAKEKICARPATVCDPLLCPRALGYYDRRRQALHEALSLERLNRSAIEELADRHELCPFELQLDLSETSDVIVCDYNYAFDPRVRLKRFFLEKSDSALLIDEAHNLIDRAREMLSAGVRQGDFRALSRALKKMGAPDTVLQDALTRIDEGFKGLRECYERPQWAEDAPESLIEPLEIFLDAARAYLGGATPFATQMTDRYFEALNFTRVAGEMKAGHRVLYDPEEKSLSVRLWCFDPSEYLAKCYHRVRGAVLFSATLAPMHYYRDALGLSEEEGDAMLDLPSPFPAENLCVVRLPLNTTFRRREETQTQVAEAILTMCRAHKGNYLACFPSHAYLGMVLEALSAQAPDIEMIAQHSSMNERARADFLARFRPNPDRTMLALIAMGGVFAEGVDLPGDLLSGAAIVGVGIPQLSLERAALVELLGGGEEAVGYAYTYPGIERVLQAAGRVIRTEEDRGVVLLIDERFYAEGCAALLPPHWQLSDARDMAELKRGLNRFWK